MKCLYLDSSAVVKYYITEPGTPWVRRVVEARTETGEWAHMLFISQLALVEVVAAVEKRFRLGEVTLRQREVVLARFASDYRHRFDAVSLGEEVLRRAVELVARHPLRAYDAVQLASALALVEVLRSSGFPPITFASADGRLCRAAEGEGLRAVNPNEIDVPERYDEGEKHDG